MLDTIDPTILAGIPARVAAGTAVLDENDPDWWQEQELDLDRLDLSNCLDCMLGQRYGTFTRGRFRLGLGLVHQAQAFGFLVLSWTNGMVEARALKAEWTRVVRARRAEAAAEVRELAGAMA